MGDRRTFIIVLAAVAIITASNFITGTLTSETAPSVDYEAVNSENFNVIDRFAIIELDVYGNTWILQPKLVAVNHGENWTCYYYFWVRVGPLPNEGNGDYGDVVVFGELWDARNLTQWGCVQYEFSRSGWDEFHIYIDGQKRWSMERLYSGHPIPADAFIEGGVWDNGTVV